MDKYQNIYRDMLDDIKSGKYTSGEFLPSDTKLVMKYNVSRETVRKAMVNLAHDGYVQRLKGKGTIVLDRQRVAIPMSQLKSYREVMVEGNITSTNDVLFLEENHEVPENLTIESAIDSDLMSTKLIRRRNVGDEATVIDYDYINQAVVDHLPREAAAESIFNYFEHNLGLQIDYAIKHMTIEPANQQDHKGLGVAIGSPMVVIRSETHLTDNRFLSFTESRHRADRFSNVEFSRRRN
jgi:GntR family trehalose operon transcriptional repressor